MPNKNFSVNEAWATQTKRSRENFQNKIKNIALEFGKEPEEITKPKTHLALELYEYDLKKINAIISKVEHTDLSNPVESWAIFQTITRLGVTLTELAKVLGVNHGSISRWARGEAQPNPANHDNLKSAIKIFLEHYRDTFIDYINQIETA